MFINIRVIYNITICGHTSDVILLNYLTTESMVFIKTLPGRNTEETQRHQYVETIGCEETQNINTSGLSADRPPPEPVHVVQVASDTEPTS